MVAPRSVVASAREFSVKTIPKSSCEFVCCGEEGSSGKLKKMQMMQMLTVTMLCKSLEV